MKEIEVGDRVRRDPEWLRAIGAKPDDSTGEVVEKESCRALVKWDRGFPTTIPIERLVLVTP